MGTLEKPLRATAVTLSGFVRCPCSLVSSAVALCLSFATPTSKPQNLSSSTLSEFVGKRERKRDREKKTERERDFDSVMHPWSGEKPLSQLKVIKKISVGKYAQTFPQSTSIRDTFSHWFLFTRIYFFTFPFLIRLFDTAVITREFYSGSLKS